VYTLYIHGLSTSVMAKSYMKVKINGKWCWKACPTPFAEYQARALCECSRCKGDS